MSQFNLETKLAKKALDAKSHTITAVASSTRRDRGGDAFSLSALRQMAEAYPGRTLFTQHRYDPSDAIGTIEKAYVQPKSGTPHSELIIVARLDSGSAKAMEIERQLGAGIALGLSVGVSVLASEIGIVDGHKTLIITSVDPLEISVVGLAALADADNIMSRKLAGLNGLKPSVDLSRAPSLSDETAIWRFLAAAKGVELRTARAELIEVRKGAQALLAAVNDMLDQPMPRKALPADQIASVIQKYPWLDARIANELARSANA